MSDQDRLEETRDVLRRMNEDPFYQNAAKKDLLATKLTGDEEKSLQRHARYTATQDILLNALSRELADGKDELLQKRMAAQESRTAASAKPDRMKSRFDGHDYKKPGSHTADKAIKEQSEANIKVFNAIHDIKDKLESSIDADDAPDELAAKMATTMQGIDAALAICVAHDQFLYVAFHKSFAVAEAWRGERVAVDALDGKKLKAAELYVKESTPTKSVKSPQSKFGGARGKSKYPPQSYQSFSSPYPAPPPYQARSHVAPAGSSMGGRPVGPCHVCQAMGHLAAQCPSKPPR